MKGNLLLLGVFVVIGLWATRFAGNQIEQDDPEAVHIRLPGRSTIPSDAVRIHIPRGAADARAEPGSSHRSLLHTPCEAEVAQLHGGQIAHGVHVHENIGTLDVAMDHALVMDMLDGRCELHSDVDPLLGVDTI